MIQPFEVKLEHARYLMEEVKLEQRIMRYADLTMEYNLWGTEPDDLSWREWHNSIGNKLKEDHLMELSRRAHDRLLIMLGQVALCKAQDAHLRRRMPLPPVYPYIPPQS